MLEFFLFRLTEVRHDPIPNNLADHLSVLLAEALPSKLKKERALHGIHDPPLQGKKLHLFTGSQSLITDAGLFLWAM